MIEVNPNGDSTPERFTIFKDKLIFFANGDGVGYEPHYVDISNITLSTDYQEINEDNITLYPNPSNNKLFISSNQNYHRIKVYDLLGNIVLKTNKQSNIDVSSLVSGYYFLKLEDESIIRNSLVW